MSASHAHLVPLLSTLSQPSPLKAKSHSTKERSRGSGLRTGCSEQPKWITPAHKLNDLTPNCSRLLLVNIFLVEPVGEGG